MPSATAAPAESGVSEANLKLIIHHVFLTPAHPQGGDDIEATRACEHALLSFVCEALRKCVSSDAFKASSALQTARAAILFLRDSKNASGALDPQKLQQAFKKLSLSGGVFPIHVEAQNAAIRVGRTKTSINFEFFELSPQNEAVMSTQGRLKRHFPGSAVSIPFEVFDNADLHSSIADTITRMGLEEVKEVKAKIKKARDTQIEERDTTDPAIVTDFLATVLSALGDVTHAPVLEKNTREQVSWKNAKLPWRRSPVWLLARVTLQSIMSRAGEPQVYKQFMVFLLSSLLEAAVSAQMPAETLYHMVAKISSRLQKLGHDAQECLAGGVEAAMAKAASCIEASWKTATQALETKLVMREITASFQQEKFFDCPKLDSFLESITSRRSYTNHLQFEPSWHLPTYTQSGLPPTTFGGEGQGKLVRLLAFEDWVANSLNNWLSLSIDLDYAPDRILELIRQYHEAAQPQYAGNPEATSLMILTIMELWVACDKSSCKKIELLKDFDHEIPRRLLQSLILPLKRDMERLHSIEAYFQARQKDFEPKQNPSIFSDFGTKKSFAVQFFASSAKHQALKTSIEEWGNLEREKKRREFQQTLAVYREHVQKAAELDHDYFSRINWRTGKSRQVHDRHCRRCYHETLAQAQTIEIHEWPLPSDPEAAQNVVFELQVPKVVSDWRSATAYVILSVLKSIRSATMETGTEDTLSNYLPKYFVTVSANSVLLRNGLTFHYYDKVDSKWVTSFDQTYKVPNSCTYQLSKSCDALQKFIFRPYQSPSGQSANHVISRQSACPEHLSLEEFRAMAALPCGYRVQWLNILTQLHMPTVDFANPDVVQMLLQISGQAGPPSGSIHRASHQCLIDPHLISKCVRGMEACLHKIEENWESYHAEKVKESEAESVRAEFLGNALQVARTCIATFDVEETRIHGILESPEDAAILIEAAITAHDAGCSVDGPQAISAHRYAKTLFRLFKYMSNEILEKRSPCLDMALKKSWSVYPGGATWEPVSHPYGHWMTTEMRTAETILPLQAHFNMLTGELLLFGKMTLESYHNYSLFFGMGEARTRDFLLVAMSDSEIYDLVPPRVFAQSLPHAFVAEHVHWYNRRSQTLEFRRKDNPWEPSPDSNWTMRKHEGGWLLERQGQHILLALDASTVNYLASLLKPFEQKDYIHVFMDRETNVVTVELPRLQLDFLMEAGSSKLYSRQFRGMFVDTDQCIHTLVGLESKLVLRNKHNRRKVLIPDGEPAWSRVSSVDHVRVSIRHGVSKKVHPYDVDTLLQRLVDNEQALSILRSASLRSFEYLKEEDIQKLSKIAQLSPHREYYPKNLRCMETVSWDSRLSFLAQDNAFHCLVAEIFAQASATKVFYPDESQEMPTLCRTHKSRDKKHHSPVSMKAFKIAEMLFLEPSGLAESVHPALVQELWASLEQSGLNRFQPIQCLAAFFKFPTMFDITIPTEAHYFLSVGYSPVRAEIYSVATEELVAFNESTEFNIPQDPDEEEADYLERRRVEYVGSQTIAVETFVTTVFAEWICKTPTTPSVGTTHVNVQRAMQKILKLWERWYNNHCFRDYLIAVVAAVGRINVVATSRRIAEASVRPLAPSCRPQLRRLCGLLDKLREVASSEHSSQLKYADELQRSFQALKQLESAQTLPPEEQERHDILANHLRICQQNFDTIKHALIAAIKAGLHKTFDKGSVENPNISSEFTVAATFMAPRCSSSIILGYLARSQWKSLPRDWKRALVTFGTALTCLQRAERLLHAKTSSDLLKELANLGHTNWNPLHNPESLLLEIESGILIREVQENIASQMRAPKDEKNAVMQLNMGEGKSSVIVPAVAAYLADGSRLVRVVVGKPQAKELLRTLVSKLGEQEVKILHRLYRECMKQGGVLLVQPEHMLSFKLMAVEYQSLANEKSTGTALVDLYHFLHVNSRDIVDESDENFSPKFELIYTMGEQRPIELSPDRWTKVLPEGIEITHNGRGRFPRTRILRAEAGALLVRSVTQRICDTGFPGLPIGRQNDQTRNAIFNYILEEKVSSDQIALVETNEGFFTDSIKGPLLLLRGLIAGRVLLFALRQKRWRVNYGLDPARTPSTNLAVPYRAKDSPSSRAEFSHPDVVILLTHLIKSDQSEVKFHEWIADAPDLPTSFRHLAGINLKDVDQVTREVFPHLRRAKNVVDYYLSHLVFSKEMKEFSHKLSSSGWDLGFQKHHATTGFSGTNDSRHVLPLDVKQLDIEEQLHTNALVLENLLRPENTVQLLCSPTTSECSGTEILLEFVAETRNGVHVILDVGAQVLELTNIQVAKKWLELLPSTEKQDAVVFFDDDDDICLDRCLAAVTLGPDITKDRLVQACMRMRKLGQGQSVVFCVSREMQSRISMITKKPLDSDVGVDDVLMWAISETHADLTRLMPLWAIQGVRFDQQKAIWDEATTDDGITLSQAHAAAFLEEEAQTIEYRYRPVPQPTTDEKLSSLFARLGLEAQTLACNEIQQRCDEFGVSQFRSAALQEEQEKELAPEVEQERQIERPRAALPSKHELHKDVLEFVATGQLPDKSPAFEMAFLTLSNTSVADWINVCQFPSDLLVTMDYSRTVQLQALQTNSRTKTALADSYQRPIQWILASEDSKIVAIISPYEAQELIPHLLKGSGKVRLHLYAPRTTLGMEPLDMLRLHTIPYANMENWVLPSHLRLQLNLFAGQLYFASFKDYADTCDMLSLAWRPSSADEFDKIIKPDGFIVGGGTRFTKSPAQGLRVLLTTLRRDCQGIDKTHWGRILSGEFLTEADFEK
ncbi:hypothetical protein PWT90_01127 [Aphanocladium album]|nr:hypothetical protein PWT90_01127 [Aphanocladium album]